MNREGFLYVKAMLKSILLWSAVFTTWYMFLLFSANPGITSIKHRLSLALLGLAVNIALYAVVCLFVTPLMMGLRVKVYPEYFALVYSFVLVSATCLFYLFNHLRAGRGRMYDLREPRLWMAFAGFGLLFLLALLVVSAAYVLFYHDHGKTWHLAVILLACCALMVFAVVRGARPGRREPPPVQGVPYTITDSPVKVIFLGADAITFRVIDPLFAQGGLPNLRIVADKGSSFVLDTIAPTKSPVVWNSIYTSLPPERHGILDFSLYKIPGCPPIPSKVKFPKHSLLRYVMKVLDKYRITRIILYNSRHRRAKALWNILNEKGKTVSILGGWTTYPAEHVLGHMVSPNFTNAIENLFMNAGKQKSLAIYPLALAQRLKDCLLGPDALTWEHLVYYLTGTRAQYEAMLEKRLVRKNMDLLHWIVAQDASFTCFANQLWQEPQDFRFLYFQQTDVLAHQFWHYFDPDPFDAIPAVEMGMFKNVVPKAYQKFDEFLGMVMRHFMDENTVLVIASDHGMLPTGNTVKSGDHISGQPQGAMFIYAPGLIKATGRGRASIYDIAPTILYLMGFPYAQDSAGEVLLDIVADDYTREHPLQIIDSYGDRKPQQQPAADLDAEDANLKHLKSLGYIQ